jgi:RNA polymerase-binding transcription factor DksA
MTDTAKAAPREVLLARLASLEARFAALDAPLNAPMSADSEDRATELEDEAALAGEERLIEAEIAAVRAAIGRADTGHYGTCIACGDAIAPARLAAIPEAALCIECATGRKNAS